MSCAKCRGERSYKVYVAGRYVRVACEGCAK
jgi:hypothetical protein